MKIHVTGYGLISSIGYGADDSIQSLRNEKTGIERGRLAHSKKYNVGAIHLSNSELKKRYNLSTDGSRTALLGMVAAKQAFEGHALLDDVRTGLISGTSVGGMDISEAEYKKYLDQDGHNPDNYKHHSSGVGSEQIAQELGISEFINTISTACSSATNAIMMGARMIRNGSLDRVIVGGTDGLTAFTIAGFKSLMIFDDEWCKPFDESRKGLNLGEGAGYIVLESDKSISITKKEPLAVLSGWSNASDAFHQTASSPDGHGAQLSMEEALNVAGLSARDIDYINAHGTATPNNDLSESQAIKGIFGDNIPPFSSTKSYTGHTLAASGGIEAVFAILAIRNGYLYPNLNFNKAIEETGLIPQQSFEENRTVKHVLSNSFGFGGNNSTIILSAV
ncbi:MAG: beta-ketoacyl-[acyl-carrier-protein] synthase family protein [Crocinitomicaceae bacterium]|nr:beta-ketoacyl-[acyl-carrier-protein] synthase family protein [Crocinitomicaceae bacterium]